MIYLFKDGHYKIKDHEDIRQYKNAKYCIFNTSSVLKGQTFSIMELKNLSKVNYKHIKGELRIDVLDTTNIYNDAPDIVDISIPSNLRPSSYIELFNIYPYLMQINSTALYIDYNLAANSIPIIQHLTIENKHNVYKYKNKDGKDYIKELEEIFSELGPITCVDSFFMTKLLILNDGEWELVKDDNIPKKFDYIGIPLPYHTEQFYLLSYKQYMKLSTMNIDGEFYFFESPERDIEEEELKLFSTVTEVLDTYTDDLFLLAGIYTRGWYELLTDVFFVSQAMSVYANCDIANILILLNLKKYNHTDPKTILLKRGEPLSKLSLFNLLFKC